MVPFRLSENQKDLLQTIVHSSKDDKLIGDLLVEMPSQDKYGEFDGVISTTEVELEFSMSDFNALCSTSPALMILDKGHYKITKAGFRAVANGFIIFTIGYWISSNFKQIIRVLVSIATIIACIAAVFVVPEVRLWLGLDGEQMKATAVSPTLKVALSSTAIRETPTNSNLPTITITESPTNTHAPTLSPSIPPTPPMCSSEYNTGSYLIHFREDCWMPSTFIREGDIFEYEFSNDTLIILAEGTKGDHNHIGDLIPKLPCNKFDAMELEIAIEEAIGSIYLQIQTGWDNGDIALGPGLNVNDPTLQLVWTENDTSLIKVDQLNSKGFHNLRMEWMNEQVLVFVDNEKMFEEDVMIVNDFPGWIKLNATFSGAGQIKGKVRNLLIECKD